MSVHKSNSTTTASSYEFCDSSKQSQKNPNKNEVIQYETTYTKDITRLLRCTELTLPNIEKYYSNLSEINNKALTLILHLEPFLNKKDKPLSLHMRHVVRKTIRTAKKTNKLLNDDKYKNSIKLCAVYNSCKRYKGGHHINKTWAELKIQLKELKELKHNWKHSLYVYDAIKLPRLVKLLEGTIKDMHPYRF